MKKSIKNNKNSNKKMYYFMLLGFILMLIGAIYNYYSKNNGIFVGSVNLSRTPIQFLPEGVQRLLLPEPGPLGPLIGFLGPIFINPLNLDNSEQVLLPTNNSTPDQPAEPIKTPESGINNPLQGLSQNTQTKTDLHNIMMYLLAVCILILLKSTQNRFSLVLLIGLLVPYLIIVFAEYSFAFLILLAITVLMALVYAGFKFIEKRVFGISPSLSVLAFFISVLVISTLVIYYIETWESMILVILIALSYLFDMTRYS
jgi:hypothetical protein